MSRVQLSVLRPFEDPPSSSELVVFSDHSAFTTEAEAPRMLRAARRYARLHQVYLVTGRFAAGGHLAQSLIAPDGEYLGGQRATHLSAANRNLFFHSEDLQIFDCPFGPIFLAVDADLLHPEVVRAAALKGARLIIGGLYLPGGEYSPMQGVCGAYNMAQQNGVFVLDANNLVTSFAAPEGTVGQEGWLLRDSDHLPLSLSLDPSIAPGPQLLLDEGFYLRYANQLGR